MGVCPNYCSHAKVAVIMNHDIRTLIGAIQGQSPHEIRSLFLVSPKDMDASTSVVGTLL